MHITDYKLFSLTLEIGGGGGIFVLIVMDHLENKNNFDKV